MALTAGMRETGPLPVLPTRIRRNFLMAQQLKHRWATILFRRSHYGQFPFAPVTDFPSFRRLPTRRTLLISGGSQASLLISQPAVPRPPDVEGPSVTPNAQRPTRSGEDLNAPSPQRQRAADGDRGFSGGHCKSPRDIATLYEHTSPIDYMAAINDPTAGRPAYRDLYGMDEIDSLLHDSVFSDMKFNNGGTDVSSAACGGRNHCRPSGVQYAC